MTPAVDMRGVAHDFAGEKALRGISLEVPAGALFGMIGADGAGKSTVFRILATLLRPQQGKVALFGRDVRTEYRALRARIGYMPQRFSLYGDLTVVENLRFTADILDVPRYLRESKIRELLEFTHLTAASGRPASRLSGGMKQKLALCCALIHEPELLLLDEPTVGVDPVTRRDFWDMLQILRNKGTTLLVSTPYMDEAELCDRVALVNLGNVLALGTPAELCGSLPGRLWRIQGRTPLHIDADFKPEAPLLSLYSTGGELRALAPTGVSPELVLELVRRIFARGGKFSGKSGRREENGGRAAEDMPVAAGSRIYLPELCNFLLIPPATGAAGSEPEGNSGAEKVGIHPGIAAPSPVGTERAKFDSVSAAENGDMALTDAGRNRAEGLAGTPAEIAPAEVRVEDVLLERLRSAEEVA